MTIGGDTLSSAKAFLLVGGIFVFTVLPEYLSIFIGPKIVADPDGFSLETLRWGQSLSFGSWAVSGLLASPVSDRIGRKPVMYTLLTVALGMVLLGARTHCQALFVASFFASGFFMSSANIAFVLVQETTSGPAKQHGASILNSTFSLFLGATAYVCTRITADVHWRLELAAWYSICYLPLMVLGPFLADESPFLVKRYKVAAPGAHHASAPGRVARDGDCAASTERAPDSPLAMLFGTELRATTLFTCVCWSSVCLAYFSLTFSTQNISDDLGLNMMLYAVVDTISYGVATTVASAVGGARRLQMGSFFLAGLLMLAMEWLTPGSQFVLIGAMAARFLVNFAFNTALMLVVEQFPAACRSSATGLANFWGRAVAMAAPHCGSWTLSTLFRFVGVVMLCASYATWWLPRPVEEQTTACHQTAWDWWRLPESFVSPFSRGREPLLASDRLESVDPDAST